MSTSLLRVETLIGQPIKINSTELRVRSQVVQLCLPIASGGLIWNRPVAVTVRMSDGQEQILPVLDLTRIAVLMLGGLCFTSLFLLILFRRKKVES
ncbi:MAG TPA: hypothetical protein VJM08_04465 [Anaerolineales bacterium]|nr:hypothetical protein [Anaerolineales bacterium]